MIVNARRIRLSLFWPMAASLIVACQGPMLCLADDDLESLEPAAFASAVERVAPSVVRIETIGGLDRVGQILLGSGPTTGLVVDPDGYIVSSAFNFINQPSSILVRLPDGVRKPATLVANDRSRMLVLLKIEVDKPLPVCEIAPRGEMRVGQWTIAVGRAFDGDHPNMAVGILSALDRVWGKAIQTDAAVSPNNYGGPLIDVRGRVMGILVPLSPEAADEIAGVEWYDSGIGFAIPAEQIQQMLPRLKKGENLVPGVAGIGMKGSNIYTGEPIIAACRRKSPADAAGIRVGDRIVEIDGRKVALAADVKAAIGRCYAGQTMRVVVLRGAEQKSCDVELAAKLDPYRVGFLGLLPMRDPVKDGIVVRYVYPESPAAKAGIARGDAVLSVAGEPVQSRFELCDAIGAHEVGEEIEIEFRHGDAARKVKVALASLPEGLPPVELPAAHGKISPTVGKKQPAVGAMPMKIAEFANEAWAYVPRGCHDGVPHGIVMWLHGHGGFDWDELKNRWKPLCDRYDLILLAPKANDATKWSPGELAFVGRLLAEAAGKYPVDPTRIVLCGQDIGGTLAFTVAMRNREAIRAVAAIDAVAKGPVAESEPLERFAVYSAMADKSRLAKSIESSVDAMRKTMIPVTTKGLGELPRSLTPEELAELMRWVDMLDRI